MGKIHNEPGFYIYVIGHELNFSRKAYRMRLSLYRHLTPYPPIGTMYSIGKLYGIIQGSPLLWCRRLFLDEDGYDKLILGEKMSDPNTGNRIVDAAGFTFNDDRGISGSVSVFLNRNR